VAGVTAPVSRSAFATLGRLAGWPAVDAPGLRLDAGEIAWERFIDASTPPDRRAILDVLAPWYTPELVATRAARERLGKWYELGRPAPSRRGLDRDLVVMGLSSVRAIVVSALRRCPPSVQHFVRGHCWIVGTDRRLDGWCWQAPPPPAGPLVLICLDGKLDGPELWGLVGHEVAHAWLVPTAPPERVTTLRERMAAANLTRQLAREWGRPDLLVQAIQRDVQDDQRDERQAAALAASWGFRGTAADPTACEDRVRPAALRCP
jgi:hypothetical protein